MPGKLRVQIFKLWHQFIVGCLYGKARIIGIDHPLVVAAELARRSILTQVCGCDPLGLQRCILSAKVLIGRDLLRKHLLFWLVGSINFIQGTARGHGEGTKLRSASTVCIEFIAGHINRIALGLACKPLPPADPFDRRGKGLVEHGVVFGKGYLVRQFMKNQTRQLSFRVVDKGVEQWVATGPVQPPKRRVGGHAINANLKIL